MKGMTRTDLVSLFFSSNLRMAASPGKLFPTTTLIAMLSAQAKPEPRQRLLDYVTNRDGQFKVAFKFFTQTSPATAYGVTFHELVHTLELSVAELVETGLVTSWLDCVNLGINLDHVIVSRKEPALYERCNMHLLRKHFGEGFDKNRANAPLKMSTRAFMKYANHLHPEDFAPLGLKSNEINAWLMAKKDSITAGDQLNIKGMLSNASREAWLLIGLAYDKLMALATTSDLKLSSSSYQGNNTNKK